MAALLKSIKTPSDALSTTAGRLRVAVSPPNEVETSSLLDWESEPENPRIWPMHRRIATAGIIALISFLRRASEIQTPNQTKAYAS